MIAHSAFTIHSQYFEASGEEIIASNRRVYKRGNVVGMSAKSRRRAQVALAGVDTSSLRGVLFVTLTLPDPLPDTAQQKNMLDKFAIYLDREMHRRLGRSVPFFWRYEFGGKTGRPHFHLIIFSALPKKDMQRVVKKLWKHVGGGFIKVTFRDAHRCAKYITKYVTKAVPRSAVVAAAEATAEAAAAAARGDLITVHNSTIMSAWTGRVWGFRYKAVLKLHQKVVYSRSMFSFLSRVEFDQIGYKLKRIVRGYFAAERRKKRGFLWLDGGKSGGLWALRSECSIIGKNQVMFKGELYRFSKMQRDWFGGGGSWSCFLHRDLAKYLEVCLLNLIACVAVEKKVVGETDAPTFGKFIRKIERQVLCNC